MLALGCRNSSTPPHAAKRVPAPTPTRKSGVARAALQSATRAPIPALAPILDSAITLPQALKGENAPEDIRRAQRLINVRYYSFDSKLHEGQVLIHKDLADDLRQIFQEIEASHFPVAKVVPIERYGWSDDASVKADNTSGFNYRKVPATHRFSAHAQGRAIDLNPWENPYMDPIRGTKQTYNPKVTGTLTATSAPVKIFRKHGWTWGGVWRRGRDYQHFEKL